MGFSMTQSGLMKLRLPWKRCLIPLVGVGTLTALAAQYTPTYGVLEHEFTVIFSAISAVMLYGLSGTVYRGVRKAMPDAAVTAVLQMALFLLLVGGLFMAATALGIMYAFNEFKHDCYFGRGMPFFWFTWAPVSLLMMVVGLWTASRGWGWIRRLLFYGAMGIASTVHGWILMERGLRLVDPLFG